jgi:hypothetical protein
MEAVGNIIAAGQEAKMEILVEKGAGSQTNAPYATLAL